MLCAALCGAKFHQRTIAESLAQLLLLFVASSARWPLRTIITNKRAAVADNKTISWRGSTSSWETDAERRNCCKIESKNGKKLLLYLSEMAFCLLCCCCATCDGAAGWGAVGWSTCGGCVFAIVGWLISLTIIMSLSLAHSTGESAPDACCASSDSCPSSSSRRRPTVAELLRFDVANAPKSEFVLFARGFFAARSSRSLCEDRSTRVRVEENDGCRAVFLELLVCLVFLFLLTKSLSSSELAWRRSGKRN